MLDFLVYGCSIVIGGALLFGFIKYTVSSIKNEGRLEKKEKELNAKIEKIQTQHNELHRFQSELNAVEVHRNNNQRSDKN